jgi:trigger factor
MVRRLYGDKAIQEEAVNLMLEDLYPEVIKESKINPYGPGKLDEINSVDPPKFTFVVPLTPEVELGDYKSIREDYVSPVVTDAKVEETIERLQRRAGTAEPVERPAQSGDLVAIKLSSRLVSPDEGQDPVLIDESNQEMIAGKPEEHTDDEGHEWPYPGFANQLVGLSAGDKKVFTYTFTDDGSSDELTGKDAEFNVEVESVKEIKLPELNDEFAQTLGQFENIEALKKDVRGQLEETETRTYNSTYIEGLISKLIEGATVKYPPELLNDEIDHVLHHFEERLGQQKLDLDTYLKTREMTKEDLIEKEVKQVAERNVRRQLVLEEFSYRENIQIQPNEVQMVYDMATTQAKRDPQVRQLARGKMSNRELTDTLARSTINEIFNQRLMTRLRDIATGKADQPAEQPAEAAVEGDPAQADTGAETVEPAATTEEPQTDASPASSDSPVENVETGEETAQKTE